MKLKVVSKICNYDEFFGLPLKFALLFMPRLKKLMLFLNNRVQQRVKQPKAKMCIIALIFLYQSVQQEKGYN